MCVQSELGDVHPLLRLQFLQALFLMMWLEDTALTFCLELSITRRVVTLAATRTSGGEMTTS